MRALALLFLSDHGSPAALVGRQLSSEDRAFVRLAVIEMT
jgi:hypothetical protein